MKMVGEEHTDKHNVLFIECDCGKKIFHPTNLTWVRCRCGRVENSKDLKRRHASKMAQKRKKGE